MYHFEGNLLSKDRLRLYWQGWQPNRQARAVIWCVHGLSDHSGRYEHVASRLEARDFAVYGFDRRGCGKSEGPRGHCPSYDMLIDDMRIFYCELQKIHPDAPILLFGLSLGAQLSLAYSMNYPQSVQGVIALSPWLTLPFKLPWWMENLANTLNVVAPSVSMDNRLNISDLSRNEEFIEDFRKDPLVHRKISARMYLQCSKAAQRLLKNPQVLETPTLLIHGDADKITSVEGSRQFAQMAPSTLMHYVEVPGGRHVLLQDACSKETWVAIEKWLSEQVPYRESNA